MKSKWLALLAMMSLPGWQMVSGAEPDLQKLSRADNDFAFKLVRQLTAADSGKNIFVSPYSAATALQLVQNGAAGRTQTEMQQVLETAGISAADLNAANQTAAAFLNADDTNVILTTANALWYRQGSAIKPDYLDLSRKFFASAIKPLDFDDTYAAEAVINRWASDQTHGRIQGMADGMIAPHTDLFLANAIYFKGKWEHPFNVKLTHERAFHAADGNAAKVAMMKMSRTFAYREGSDYQAVRLPYAGRELAMYVFLPAAGSNPAKLLQTMNGTDWEREMMPAFRDRQGLLVLPKFKLENTLKLNAPLEALGMKTAFDPKRADFSGMFSDPHYISAVCQKAFVDVSEEGTEAAAVTGIAVMAAGLPMQPEKPFEMIVNRPFVFAIVDSRSGMILFVGVVERL